MAAQEATGFCILVRTSAGMVGDIVTASAKILAGGMEVLMGKMKDFHNQLGPITEVNDFSVHKIIYCNICLNDSLTGGSQHKTNSV